MKKIVSYLLLCVYAIFIVKPVMPTITDVLAHIFNYSEHMATVHQHNGKYHVHLEYLAAAKKDTRSENPSNNFKKSDTSSEYTFFPIKMNIIVPSINKIITYTHLRHLPDISLQQALRPPIMSLS